MIEMRKYKTINAYFKNFPIRTQKLLKQLRSVIKKSSPGSTEAIKYGIPTFVFNGKNLVHFAAYKSHIGFYPTSSGVREFRSKLGAYKTSKGTIQFPLDMPLPLDLVVQIVQFRVRQVLD